MFNLTVYCRRTLNTIPPEGGAVRPVNSSPEPAVRASMDTTRASLRERATAEKAERA